MGLVEHAVNVALFQLGLKFLIPAAVIVIAAYILTGGRSYVPIFLGLAGGAISWIVLTALGL